MLPRRKGYNESFGVDLEQLDKFEEHEALVGGVRRTQLIREMSGAREASSNEEVSEKEDKSPGTLRYEGVL